MFDEAKRWRSQTEGCAKLNLTSSSIKDALGDSFGFVVEFSRAFLHPRRPGLFAFCLTNESPPRAVGGQRGYSEASVPNVARDQVVDVP
jgi:hypothetical protein